MFSSSRFKLAASFHIHSPKKHNIGAEDSADKRDLVPKSDLFSLLQAFALSGHELEMVASGKNIRILCPHASIINQPMIIPFYCVVQFPLIIHYLSG